jgi:hypothetical protein
VTDALFRPEPLGLPVPEAWLYSLKLFGFILHMIFMNLWLAGMPAALLLRNSQPLVGRRLFKAMPFFMAFGINAGIVPLLFLQTLYPQSFYPATILQGWFWLAIVPLLIVAYYAVYLAAFDRYRVAAATVASLLLAWIGLTFSAAMSLTAAPEQLAAIFAAQAEAGAVHGRYLYLRAETIFRFLIMLGIAVGTLAAFLALDAEFFTKNPGYKHAARRCVAPLYGIGTILFGSAGWAYSASVKLAIPFPAWLLAGLCMPLGALLSLYYWRSPAKRSGGLLIFVHFMAIVANALARETTQRRSLADFARLDVRPVRGDWDGFFLFLFVLVVVLVALGWLARVAIRAAESRP